MTLQLTDDVLAQIHAHGEKSYPEEGAGFLLGAYSDNGTRAATAIFPLANSREDEARHNRYLITPEDYLKAELEADRLGLSLIGVFHSHPDHPNRPSEFDREWAQPFFLLCHHKRAVRQGHREPLVEIDRRSYQIRGRRN